MPDLALQMMNDPLSQEEFNLWIEDMKNFMALVLKIAFAQHLSNQEDNKTANDLYESFFPNTKKKTNGPGLGCIDNCEPINVTIQNHGGRHANMVDQMMSDKHVPSPQLRAKYAQQSFDPNDPNSSVFKERIERYVQIVLKQDSPTLPSELATVDEASSSLN
jgi:hypothetical protein